MTRPVIASKVIRVTNLVRDLLLNQELPKLGHRIKEVATRIRRKIQALPAEIRIKAREIEKRTSKLKRMPQPYGCGIPILASF